MARKKQVNNEKRAVMAREEPSCDRSFVMVPEELRRIYPNVKMEYIEPGVGGVRKIQVWRRRERDSGVRQGVGGSDY